MWSPYTRTDAGWFDHECKDRRYSAGNDCGAVALVRASWIYRLVGALGMLVGAVQVHAASQALERLLMPGPVSAAHAKYETDCAQCHDFANRPGQAQLCATCHEPVRDDIRAGKGLHGRLPNAAMLQCRGCHTEHKGRDTDIVKFVALEFDHSKTDFELADAHATVPCASCHQAGKPYREAAGQCSGCHLKDEPHEGRLGKDCASCHDSVAWSRARYDHGKTTFPLENKHAEVPCAACHFGNRYDGTPQACASCHSPDDVHRGARGTDCASCHTTKEWQTARFNHEKETGFALRGAHADTACASCHKTGRYEDKVPKDCHGCHLAEDTHAGRLGEKCGDCHTNDAFKPAKFDHDKDTKYLLEGEHKQVSCHACHTAPVAQQSLQSNCSSCHAANDVHAAKLGTQCESCHAPAGWRFDVRFDHDLSDFQLLGQHAAVPCEQCHLTQSFKDTASGCNDCHAKTDVHKGSLGKECASCHSPNGWGIWEFDHGKQTGFGLTGAHGKLTCAGCHRQPPDVVKLSQDCVACHQDDDAHFGDFGRQCERCHVTLSFKQVRIR